MGEAGEDEQIQRFARAFSAVAAFFTDSKYGALATWIQTLLLAATLMYTGVQVAQLFEQNREPRLKEFHDRRADFDKHLLSRIELVRRLAWRSRLPDLTAEQFRGEMSGVDVKATVGEYLEFLVSLDQCETDEVCDKKKTLEFLCNDAEHTYLAFNHDLKQTHQPEWTALQVWDHEVVFNQLIHDHCGLANRLWFFVQL